jgi:hypothetical protein
MINYKRKGGSAIFPMISIKQKPALMGQESYGYIGQALAWPYLFAY